MLTNAYGFFSYGCHSKERLSPTFTRIRNPPSWKHIAQFFRFFFPSFSSFFVLLIGFFGRCDDRIPSTGDKKNAKPDGWRLSRWYPAAITNHVMCFPPSKCCTHLGQLKMTFPLWTNQNSKFLKWFIQFISSSYQVKEFIDQITALLSLN